MAALASNADVEAVIGRSLTSEEEERIDYLLGLASREARRLMRGRHFEAGSYTVARKVRNGRVQLPDLPESVDEVRVLYSDGTDEVLDVEGYTVRGSVIYGLGLWCEVEVDYTTTETAPDDVVQAVASAAARGVLEAPGNPAIESETVGAYSVRYRETGATSTALPYERAVFSAYATPALGPVRVL